MLQSHWLIEGEARPLKSLGVGEQSTRKTDNGQSQNAYIYSTKLEHDMGLSEKRVPQSIHRFTHHIPYRK